jgi:prephenate dehydratase
MPREYKSGIEASPVAECYGFLGPEGSFSYQALVKYLKRNLITDGETSIREYKTFYYLAHDLNENYGDDGKLLIDSAIFPMENSVAGKVIENYRWIAEHDFWVIGAIALKLDSALITRRGARRIDTIYSHPKALDSAKATIVELEESQESPISRIETNSTSAALEFILDNGGENDAAISSAWAFNKVPRKRKANFQISKRYFSDAGRKNVTRFYIVSNKFDDIFNPLFSHELEYQTFLTMKSERRAETGKIIDLLAPFKESEINVADFFFDKGTYYMVVDAHPEDLRFVEVKKSLPERCKFHGCYVVLN